MSLLARLKTVNAKQPIFDDAACEINIPWREYQFRWDWFIYLSLFFVAVILQAGLAEFQRLGQFLIAAPGFVVVFGLFSFFWFRQFNNENITFPFHANVDGIGGTGEYMNAATSWHEIDEIRLTHPSRGLAFGPLRMGLSLRAKGKQLHYIGLPFVTPEEFIKLDQILARLAAMHGVEYRR
ncbi:hypothetical protein [Maritalea mediterranea]|uniref:YcxB-like protein domain-containing protein n=1 Tax=Maritalea mediterranea TaxID=2909667 RepID=A0ABS9E9R4_9HYPH|nr:hypothetical protein [Maritalea mediterranea]MCF4098191.1 hypothetical protein [Maritalea mediterranea]